LGCAENIWEWEKLHTLGNLELKEKKLNQKRRGKARRIKRLERKNIRHKGKPEELKDWN